MKTWRQKFIFFLSFLILIVGLERIFHELSEGFSLPSIRSTLPYNESWNLPLSTNTLEKVGQILSQEFVYLASGSQVYAFISEDGEYVIKFFKHKRWRLNPLMQAFPLPSALDRKRERWKEKKEQTVDATFGSCILSYTEFQQQTGVIFLHLNRTNYLKRSLILSDRLKIKHQIDLDEVQFALQKRAIPTDVYLMKLHKKKETEKAKNAISSLINFAIWRAEKGYSDKDPHPIRNFGFLNDQVIEIDIGGFHKDERKGLDYFYSHEIFKIREKFRPWLEKYYPELLPFTEQQFEKVIKTKRQLS